MSLADYQHWTRQIESVDHREIEAMLGRMSLADGIHLQKAMSGTGPTDPKTLRNMLGVAAKSMAAEKQGAPFENVVDPTTAVDAVEARAMIAILDAEVERGAKEERERIWAILSIPDADTVMDTTLFLAFQSTATPALAAAVMRETIARGGSLTAL